VRLRRAGKFRDADPRVLVEQVEQRDIERVELSVAFCATPYAIVDLVGLYSGKAFRDTELAI